jgi:transposase-like protein
LTAATAQAYIALTQHHVAITGEQTIMDATPVGYIPPARGITANRTGRNLPDDIETKLAEATQKKNDGAVSKFTEERATTIAESNINGSTIQQACEKAGITRSTYYAWRELIPSFQHMVTQAQELQADSMVDDNVINLESVDCSSDADPRLVMAQLRKAEQVARFKFDLAKCLNFKKYGDKKQQLNLNHNINHEAADVSAWFNP